MSFLIVEYWFQSSPFLSRRALYSLKFWTWPYGYCPKNDDRKGFGWNLSKQSTKKNCYPNRNRTRETQMISNSSLFATIKKNSDSNFLYFQYSRHTKLAAITFHSAETIRSQTDTNFDIKLLLSIINIKLFCNQKFFTINSYACALLFLMRRAHEEVSVLRILQIWEWFINVKCSIHVSGKLPRRIQSDFIQNLSNYMAKYLLKKKKLWKNHHNSISENFYWKKYLRFSWNCAEKDNFFSSKQNFSLEHVAIEF